MISRKSSPDSFGITLRKGFMSLLPVCIIPALALILFGSGGVFGRISEYRQLVARGMMSRAAELKAEVIYDFFPDGDGEIIVMGFCLLFMAAAIFAAFLLFGFMLKKNTSNVYYSLGISRSRLFVSRYLAGVLWIALSACLPFLILAVANLLFYGNSPEMWKTFLYIFISVFALMLFCFTVTAFVISQLGSYIEAVIISAVCIVSPGLLNRGISALLSVTAKGSPYNYGNWLGSYVSFLNYRHELIYQPAGTIWDTFSLYFPLNTASGSFMMAKGDEFVPFNYGKYIIFIIVSLVIALIAALLHNHRKNEKAGFMGTCPVLEGWCVVAVGTFLASLVASVFGNSELGDGTVKALTAAAGIVIMAVGYTVVDLFFVRSFKAYRKRLWHLAVSICAFLIIIFATGVVMNSVYSKVPDAAEIESVSVSLPDAFSSDEGYSSYESGIQLEIDRTLRVRSYDRMVVEGFESREDIERIRELNTLLSQQKKEDKGSYSFLFIYKLKNGRTVKRLYTDGGEAAFVKALEAVKTDVYRQSAAKSFEYLNYIDGGYLFVSPNMSSAVVPAKLYNDFDLKAELMGCLEKDVLAGTLDPALAPGAEVLGYICVPHYQVPTAAQPDEYNENGPATLSADYSPAELDGALELVNYNIFPVTPGMENTLAFIKSNGLDGYFRNRAETEEITVCTCVPDSDDIAISDDTGKIAAKMFPEDYVMEFYTEYGEVTVAQFKLPDNAQMVTDKAEIEKLEKAVRLTGYGCYGNKYARLLLSDGTVVFAYLPE